MSFEACLAMVWSLFAAWAASPTSVGFSAHAAIGLRAAKGRARQKPPSSLTRQTGSPTDGLHGSRTCCPLTSRTRFQNTLARFPSVTFRHTCNVTKSGLWPVRVVPVAGLMAAFVRQSTSCLRRSEGHRAGSPPSFLWLAPFTFPSPTSQLPRWIVMGYIRWGFIPPSLRRSPLPPRRRSRASAPLLPPNPTNWA